MTTLTMARETLQTPNGTQIKRRGLILTTTVPALEGATLRTLEDFVAQSDKLKGSFFWSPPANASGRRSYEARNGFPRINFIWGKDEYSMEISVSCSCKNIYVEKTILKNSMKTDVRAIKRIIAALS